MRESRWCDHDASRCGGNHKSFSTHFLAFFHPSVSIPSFPLFLSVRLCLSRSLSFCSHNSLLPAALITTSTKYPVENTSSLIRDCSILSVQRHHFLSRRLGYQTRERLRVLYWFIDIAYSVQPWICLNLKVEPHTPWQSSVGRLHRLLKCPHMSRFLLCFQGKKHRLACLAWIMALKRGCWSVCATEIFKVRAARGRGWSQRRFIMHFHSDFVQISCAWGIFDELNQVKIDVWYLKALNQETLAWGLRFESPKIM